MDTFLTCVPGASSVCAQNIKELIGKDALQLPAACLCRDVTPRELALLAYRAQSAFRVGVLLGQGTMSSFSSDAILAETKKVVNKDLLAKFFSLGESFAVHVQKLTQTALQSTDIAALFGDALSALLDEAGLSYSINLSKPQRRLFVQLSEGEVLIGLDLVGFSLGKRPYKMFIHPSSLGGVLAYTIARLGGVEKESVVLDPFCGSGTFPIEVALFQEGLSCYHFEDKLVGLHQPEFACAFKEVSDELRASQVGKQQRVFGFDHMLKIVKGAQKNAKIAGVFNAITFSKVALDWVDAKFDEHSVDCVLGNPPRVSKRLGNARDVHNLLDELFYQAKYLLKHTGSVTLLLGPDSDVEQIAAKHEFALVKKQVLPSGKLPVGVFVFKRG